MYISPQGESGPSSDPETTLFLQAQAGCADRLNQLLIHHERFVHWIVWRQQLCGLAYDEAVQAARKFSCSRYRVANVA